MLIPRFPLASQQSAEMTSQDPWDPTSLSSQWHLSVPHSPFLHMAGGKSLLYSWWKPLALSSARITALFPRESPHLACHSRFGPGLLLALWPALTSSPSHSCLWAPQARQWSDSKSLQALIRHTILLNPTHLLSGHSAPYCLLIHFSGTKKHNPCPLFSTLILLIHPCNTF